MLSTRILRIVTLACCAVGTLFWLYTFYHISQLPPGDGTGFQWIAEVPLTGIFLLLTLPALALSRSDRTIAFATLLASSVSFYTQCCGRSC